MICITSKGASGSFGFGVNYDLNYKDLVIEFGPWYIAIGIRKMSTLRRNWLKRYFTLNGANKKETDKLVNRLDDHRVDEMVEEIRKDLEEMVNKAMVFDEDFVEFLHEMGYEDEIDMNDLVLEFADWLAEETVAA